MSFSTHTINIPNRSSSEFKCLMFSTHTHSHKHTPLLPLRLTSHSYQHEQFYPHDECSVVKCSAL